MGTVILYFKKRRWVNLNTQQLTSTNMGTYHQWTQHCFGLHRNWIYHLQHHQKGGQIKHTTKDHTVHQNKHQSPQSNIKKPKKAKKKISAESSISDNHNSSDEDNTQETNEVAYMHKIITGKKAPSKKESKKN